MIEIQIDSQYRQHKFDSILQNAAAQALRNQGETSEGGLTIVITDDEQLRRFNNQYRGLDEVTDVLSFGAENASGEEDSDYLGDILISYQRATAQAEDNGHSIEHELELLTVHGVLHLMGYEHATDDGQAAMWAAQQEILDKLGNPLKP